MTGARKRNHVPDSVSAVHGRSHYVVTPWGVGWGVTIRRRGKPEETVLCRTLGEVNVLRQKLTDAGLVGLVVDGRAGR